MRMLLLFVAATVTAGSFLTAQERKVPEDSQRISIPGCARNRLFVVGESSEHEPVNSNVQPGWRFRMSGPKKVLEEIKKHGSQMVEITGLVRKADLAGPGGVALGGGRVRIGGSMPQTSSTDISRSPGMSQAMIDVESWRPLPDSCPEK
jgi:hypothetical protein